MNILSVYPKAYDCIDGHVGDTELTWFEEVDDDRAYLIIVPRCERCGLPVGADEYADKLDRADYRAGKQPASKERA